MDHASILVSAVLAAQLTTKLGTVSTNEDLTRLRDRTADVSCTALIFSCHVACTEHVFSLG